MYNLAEFKRWLEADESRKEGFSGWDIILNNQVTTDTHLEKLIQQEDYQGQRFNSSNSWKPYRQVVLQWKAEVDTRERERERAIQEKICLKTALNVENINEFQPRKLYAILAEKGANKKGTQICQLIMNY